jgi:hypothetical protein
MHEAGAVTQNAARCDKHKALFKGTPLTVTPEHGFTLLVWKIWSMDNKKQ